MGLRRRFHEEEAENHDRWLVSYADFITLLFAFFVVMYALSTVNQNKYRDLTSSLNNAFGQQNSALNKTPLSETVRSGPANSSLDLPGLPLNKLKHERLRKERENMTGIAINLANTLSPLIKAGQLRVIQNNEGIRIEISDSILFAPGSAALAPSSTKLLQEIAHGLAADHHRLQIEGHTDNLPIHNVEFFSNWELSAVRASTLVRMFVMNDIEEPRLSAVGYGASRPLADNNTVEGRAKNRRVSMTLLYANPNPSEGSEILPTH
ncbi:MULTISPECIES: flagellar motor protein MotD [Methylotenera]|uniref:flagellar motor protein MotD n=1 Tax=Methylotenera TaxID=359407 RepID=UPI00035FEEBD|nr:MULTISPECIES: flagellar motor protein MotD [Methylotenera]